MKFKIYSLLLLSSLLLPGLEAAPASANQPAKPNKGPFAALFGGSNKVDRNPIRRTRSPLFSFGLSNTKKNAYAHPQQPRGIVNWALLGSSNSASNHVVVDISKQRAFLLDSSGNVLINTPISSGRPGYDTPRGGYGMTERVRSGKVSTIYGVGMPFWMRLGGSLVGLHAGYLPGFPASHGCVRLPYDMAELIYDHTSYGTRVDIFSSWSRF